MLAELGLRGFSRELQFKALDLTETMTAMIDYALQFHPERADAAMYEVTRIVKRYIEDLFRQSAGPSSSANTAD